MLEAAYELMIRQGYDATSMDDVANRVGISKATLYSHFASKEDLAISMIVGFLRSGEELMQALDPSRPALERLAEVVRCGLAQRSGLAAARITVLPERLRSDGRFTAELERLSDLMNQLVDAAKEEGAVAAELPTPLVTNVIFALIASGNRALPGSAPPAALGDALVSILFNGICADRAEAAAL